LILFFDSIAFFQLFLLFPLPLAVEVLFFFSGTSNISHAVSAHGLNGPLRYRLRLLSPIGQVRYATLLVMALDENAQAKRQILPSVRGVSSWN
jgi:hypothetical protein